MYLYTEITIAGNTIAHFFLTNWNQKTMYAGYLIVVGFCIASPCFSATCAMSIAFLKWHVQLKISCSWNPCLYGCAPPPWMQEWPLTVSACRLNSRHKCSTGLNLNAAGLKPSLLLGPVRFICVFHVFDQIQFCELSPWIVCLSVSICTFIELA